MVDQSCNTVTKVVHVVLGARLLRSRERRAVSDGLRSLLRERFLAIPNNSNTHSSFGAWSPVHARARRADRVAR